MTLQWIMILAVVTFLIEELIRYKINLFSVFQETKDGKISSKRVGMIIATILFVWMGKELFMIEKIEFLNVLIFFMTGLFAFFPNSARELISKFLDKYDK